MKLSKIKVNIIMARKEILSQKDLADQAGISRQTLCYVLNGRSCKPCIVGKIALALDVDVTEIIED